MAVEGADPGIDSLLLLFFVSKVLLVFGDFCRMEF